MPNDDQRFSFSDETADVTIRREIIKFYGPALGRGTMGTLAFLKDLALRYRENDPERCEKDEFSLSYTELANLIGCSRDPLVDDIAKLTELGLIIKVTEKAEKSDKKWNETNRYRIKHPDFNPSQELVRKYWPTWWIRPEIKAFKIGSLENQQENSTTSSSSRKSSLLESSRENRLHNTPGSPDSRLPTSSVVRLPDGNVVVVNLKETTRPDFVAVLLVEEIRRCQKYQPDFNAKIMIRYWSKSLEKTFSDNPNATLNDVRDRMKAVLDVADKLKKKPNNFLVWFMAGVRDGYVPNPGEAGPKEDKKAGEAADRRRAEKAQYEQDLQKDLEKRKNATVREMVEWFHGQPAGIGKAAALRMAKTRFEVNSRWPEALKQIQK